MRRGPQLATPRWSRTGLPNGGGALMRPVRGLYGECALSAEQWQYVVSDRGGQAQGLVMA